MALVGYRRSNEFKKGGWGNIGKMEVRKEACVEVVPILYFSTKLKSMKNKASLSKDQDNFGNLPRDVVEAGDVAQR